MFVTDVDKSLKPVKAKLILCKPNRQAIAILSEAFGIKLNPKIGNLNQLDFSLPYSKEVRHKLVKNKNIDLAKYRYQIKCVRGTEVEWFVIGKPIDHGDSNGEYKSYQCLSAGIELADKNIRSYSVIAKNASSVLQDALSNTIWSIGSVAASFDTQFRSFDVSSSTVLDFLFNIAATFNALIDFDSVNRKINFYDPTTYFIKKQFTVSYGKLMDSVEQEQVDDEFCTRLKVEGKNGISINGVTPSGSNYIEDYSFFLHGFQRDANKTVLSSSDYWSDSLCNAYLDYQALIQSKKGQFQSLLSQKSGYQSTLTSQQNTLYTYQNDLKVIEDQISVANYNGQDTSSLVTQKNSKNTQITTQQGLVDATKTSIANVDSQITTLQSQISVQNNFTAAQIQEWNQFIIEKEIVNDNIENEQELYDFAVAKFEEIKQPKIVVKVGIVNLFSCIEEAHNWDRVGIGYVANIKHPKLGINVQANITEMNIDYESDSISLTISNVRELLTDKERFLRDLYRANSTSTTVSMDKYKWEGAFKDVNDVQTILNNAWDAAARTIRASENESVEIGRKGIITKDLTDANKYVVIQHGVIGLTKNDGNTWDTAIDANGIYAQRLIGQIIAGVNLTITNSAGNFLVNSTGVQVTDLTLSVTRSDGKSRILIDPTNGIKVQTKNGASWNDSISLDTNGGAVFTGGINATSGTFSGNITASGTITGGTISGANFNNGAIVGSSIDVGNGAFTVNSSGGVIASNITITGGSINWSNVGSDPKIGTAQSAADNAKSIAQQIAAGTYSGGTFISGTTIYSPNISGANITGGTISSNTSINVGTNATIGDNLYLGNQSSSISNIKSIYWNSGANISNMGDGIGGYSALKISASTIKLEGQVQASSISAPLYFV